MSLIKSYELEQPVRVIRGFKGYNKWSPATGYRYDGVSFEVTHHIYIHIYHFYL